MLCCAALRSTALRCLAMQRATQHWCHLASPPESSDPSQMALRCIFGSVFCMRRDVCAIVHCALWVALCSIAFVPLCTTCLAHQTHPPADTSRMALRRIWVIQSPSNPIRNPRTCHAYAIPAWNNKHIVPKIRSKNNNILQKNNMIVKKTLFLRAPRIVRGYPRGY